jgi:DegV family protein with EDD domain
VAVRQGVAVVTDTACDLPPQLAEELGVELAPVHVIVDGHTDLRDHWDISTDEFYRLLKEGGHQITTSAVSPVDFVGAYHRAFQRADEVLGIILARSYSATYSNASVAAEEEEFQDRTIVLEQGSVLARQGLMVVAAAERAQEGANMEELLALVGHLRAHTHMVFLSGGLEHMRQGGRLRSQEAGGSEGVPILRPLDKFTLVERQPTREKALRRLVELMEDDLYSSGWDGHAPVRVAIDEAMAPPEEVEELAQEVARRFPVQRMWRWKVGPTAAAHLGPGTLGLAYHVAP